MMLENITCYEKTTSIKESLFFVVWVTGQANDHLIFLSVLHSFLSVTAVVGNNLILIALYKESSLHPPSKLLYRNLAVTDICVGIILEPLAVTYWIAHLTERWTVWRYALDSNLIISYILCSVSLLTMTAISVDRLLALMLGLRYRHVVTLKRTYASITMFWVVSIVGENDVVSESHNYFMVRKNWHFIMSDHFSLLLHSHFSHFASKQNSARWSCFSKKIESSNSTEHSSVQKGSVQCTVGASNIVWLLSAVWYSGSFEASRGLSLTFLPCYEVYCFINVLKLIFKPFVILLEDQRSQTSGKRNTQTHLLY